MRTCAWMAAAALLAVGCSDDGSTGPEGEGALTLRFAASGAQSGAGQDAALSVTGVNGTLVVTDVRMILREFEFKQNDRLDECEGSGSGNTCREIGIAPIFLDLPLTGGVVTLGTVPLAAGSYAEMEFEVENPRSGEEDAAALQALYAQIRSQPAFTDWPEGASILMVGTFNPAGGGTPRPFRAYFAAQLEVEVPLQPPLQISGSDARTVTLSVDPRQALMVGPLVVDLSLFNGRLIDLEFRLDQGVTVTIDD